MKNLLFLPVLFFLVQIFVYDVSNSYAIDFSNLAEKNIKSVVNISTKTLKKKMGEEKMMSDLPEDHPFRQLLPLFPNLKPFLESQPKEPSEVNSLGSGFVFDEGGYIATNHHVIDGADEITVTFYDGKSSKAEMVGYDKKTDLAMLKLMNDDIKLYEVTFGNSDSMKVGNWVVAIGNPFGLGGSVSAGIISARARDIYSGPYDDYIQTDAAINRGNSGGPLFNINGKVIGINTAIFSPSGGNVGIGFAIPSAMAKPILEKLKEGTKIERGWIGVQIRQVTEEFAKTIGRENDLSGALIQDVQKDSPAYDAKLMVGDVILEFDNKTISKMRDLPRIVADITPNSNVDITLWRDEELVTTKIKVGLLKADEKNKDTKRKNILGLHLENYSSDKEDKESFTGVKILKIEDEVDSQLRANDVIVQIVGSESKVVKDVEDFQKQMEEVKDLNKNSVLFLIKRNNRSDFAVFNFK